MLESTQTGWLFKVGEHNVNIDRCKELLTLSPVFKKDQCGVIITIANMRKDSQGEQINMSLDVVDPDYDSIDLPLISLIQRFQVQYALGTFGAVKFPSDHFDQFPHFAGRLLGFLGEDPNVYIRKDTRIPIFIGSRSHWSINTGMGTYTATRSHEHSIYTTKITCALKTTYNHDSPYTVSREVIFKSREAIPLDFEHVQTLF